MPDIIEISNAKTTSSTKSKKAIIYDSYQRCEGCLKHSCVCGEISRTPKFLLRSRLTPNNFKRTLLSSQKSNIASAAVSVVTPNFVRNQGLYIPYIHSKKNIKSSKKLF